jgi:hypothetical protein
MDNITVNVTETIEDITVNITKSIDDITVTVSNDKGDKGDKGDPGASVWGAITGTLSSQTDLQNALNLKSNTSHNHNLNDLTEKSYNSLTDKTGTNTVSFNPTSPASITGTGARMFGLGTTLVFTPSKTGKVIFYIDFIPTGSGTPSSQSTYRLAYGTGVAPANGAVATGTQFDTSDSGSNYAVAVGGPNHNFTHNFYLSLVTNTAYWFDVQGTKATGATGVGMSTVRVTIKEVLF